MNQFISLAEAKRQLGIDAFDNDDDLLLLDLIKDATALVASAINREVYKDDSALNAAIEAQTAGEYAISLTDPIKGRIVQRLTKLLVAHCFKYREPVTEENTKSVFLTYSHALEQIRIPV